MKDNTEKDFRMEMMPDGTMIVVTAIFVDGKCEKLSVKRRPPMA